MHRATAVLATITAITMALASGGVAAGGLGDARAVVTHIFEMADGDADGTLTPAEYDEAGLARYGVSFEQCDGNADGEMSVDEYIETYERFHPADAATL
jgi:hypothetical protein